MEPDPSAQHQVEGGQIYLANCMVGPNLPHRVRPDPPHQLVGQICHTNEGSDPPLQLVEPSSIGCIWRGRAVQCTGFLFRVREHRGAGADDGCDQRRVARRGRPQSHEGQGLSSKSWSSKRRQNHFRAQTVCILPRFPVCSVCPGGNCQLSLQVGSDRTELFAVNPVKLFWYSNWKIASEVGMGPV